MKIIVQILAQTDKADAARKIANWTCDRIPLQVERFEPSCDGEFYRINGHIETSVENWPELFLETFRLAGLVGHGFQVTTDAEDELEILVSSPSVVGAHWIIFMSRRTGF